MTVNAPGDPRWGAGRYRAAGAPPLELRRRPRQARSRQTVEFVLEAAGQLFGRHGYNATTTNEVAERAGVSVGTLYQYFPNKDALLLALAERHVVEAGGALAQVADALREADPDWAEVVRTFVQTVVALNAAPLHAVLVDQAPRTDALRELLDGLRSAAAIEIAGHLRRLGRGGQDPDLLAELLVATVDAAVHDVVIRRPDPAPATEALIAVSYHP